MNSRNFAATPLPNTSSRPSARGAHRTHRQPICRSTARSPRPPRLWTRRSRGCH